MRLAYTRRETLSVGKIPKNLQLSDMTYITVPNCRFSALSKAAQQADDPPYDDDILIRSMEA